MRNLLLLTYVLSLVACAPRSQSVDLDRFSFNARYRNLPQRPLDTAYRTYSVNIETGQVMKALNRREEMLDQLVIDGWKQLPYDAHVQISVEMEDVLIEGSEMTTRVYPIKDKEGKQIGERKTFRNQVRYSYAAHWKMSDYKGNVIHQEVIATRMNKATHTSPEYNSEVEARAASMFGFVGLLNQLNQQTMNGIIRDLSGWLTNNYGFTENYVSDFLWILNKRKHDEHEGFHRAFISFRQAMMYMNPNDPLDEVKMKMKPAIDYFNNVKRMYAGSTSRNDRKILYAASFNLAKIYYYLDEPEKSMAEAGEVVMNGYDAREGERLQNWAAELQNRMQVNGVKTRHFPRNPESFRGPDIAAGMR
jgi:hypothetical protein